jgi:hypothetical protein
MKTSPIIMSVDLESIESFSDPISTVFELNERMLARITKIRYIINYGFYTGTLISLASALALIILFLEGEPFSALQSLLITFIIISAPIAYISYHQSQFVEEYEILASAVSRANRWQSEPIIPDGQNPIDRYLAYLENIDERVAYFKKKRDCLSKDVDLKGKSKNMHHFDAVFDCSTYPWDKAKESETILIRVLPKVTKNDIMDMKKAAEDVLAAIPKKWHAKAQAARVVLIQTSAESFNEDAVAFANEEGFEYERSTVSGKDLDWWAPIELVAERTNGKYLFGTVYFG